MDNLLKISSESFDLNLWKFSLPVQYWQAVAIVALLFLLLFALAQFRRHKVDWSLNGAVFGIFFGFLLALLLEGFLIIGGRTALTSVLGWENPPPFIATVLDNGKNKLVQVLGINTQIPSSFAKDNTTVQEVVGILQNLNPNDTKTVKAILCQ